MLSAGSFNQAVMWQQFQSSNPLPPGNPLVFELLMISPSPPPAPPPPHLLKAKVTFKCPTLVPDLTVKYPFPRNKHQKVRTKKRHCAFHLIILFWKSWLYHLSLLYGNIIRHVSVSF